MADAFLLTSEEFRRYREAARQNRQACASEEKEAALRGDRRWWIAMLLMSIISWLTIGIGYEAYKHLSGK